LFLETQLVVSGVQEKSFAFTFIDHYRITIRIIALFAKQHSPDLRVEPPQDCKKTEE
jgi:hypothetical protein